MLTILSVEFSGIKYIHIFVQTSSFSISRMLSILQNWDSTPIKWQLPIPLSSQPPATTFLLSVSMNLTILSTSYKWYHTVIVFLCVWLAYFT